MPLRPELVEITNFAGGLNLTSDAFHVGPTETADCLNVDFDIRGAVSKRKGYTVFNTAGTEVRDFLLPFTSNTGTTRLVVAAPSAAIFQVSDSGTKSAISGATSQSAATTHDGVVIKGAAYIVNGVDATAKWDGTTFTRLGTTSGADGNQPIAKTVCIHKSRIFFGNTDAGANPSRVRYSGSDASPTNVEHFKATSFIDVQQDDGDAIAKLVPFLDSLLIFKRNSTWVLRGNNPRDFELILANPSVGCIAPRSAVAWDKGVVFLSSRGVFSFDGSKVVRISEKIDPAINALPIGTLKDANGVVFQQKYYLFVNELGGGYPDTAYVFDFISLTWTKYRNWAVWHSVIWNRAGGDELHAIDASDRDRNLQLRSGTSDGGSTINAYFTTKWLDFGVPERRKMNRRMYAWFQASGDYDVNIDVQRNYQSANVVSKTVDLNPNGMIWGTSTWGAPTLWGVGQEIIRARLTGLGTTVAIRVKVFDTSTNPWIFEALAFILQPRNFA